MKKLLAAVIASFALSMAACQSVESAKVDPATPARPDPQQTFVPLTQLKR